MADANDVAARLTAAGLNAETLRGVKKRIDKIGWQICHHLRVDTLALSLDEALHLGALLARVVPHDHNSKPD
jgi:hypothetical protein